MSAREDEEAASRRIYRRSDRRRRPTVRLSKYAFVGGRRRGPRRGGEREGSFVDLYGTRLLALVLWIATMNVADSFFTLIHLQSGGVELNPMAAGLLRTGRRGFVLYKSLLIGVALVVLCVHKNFALARVGLWTSAATYTALVGYHLFLFRFHE